MVAVDTNILVRFIVQDDPVLTQRATEIIENAELNSLLLDRLILCELDYVLGGLYHFEKADRFVILKSLVNDERYNIPNRELVEQTVALFASEKPLSFEDCWLLALKRAGKVKSVATFDANLAKRA